MWILGPWPPAPPSAPSPPPPRAARAAPRPPRARLTIHIMMNTDNDNYTTNSDDEHNHDILISSILRSPRLT